MLRKKGLYVISIKTMQLRSPKLQDHNIEVWKLQSKDLPEGWEDMKDIFYYQGLPYILEIIQSILINYNNNDQLANYFRIEKT